MTHAELITTVKEIAARGKGILAADESNKTIEKRFKSINLESTEENRRVYRELLFTTPELGKYISGVILYEETLFQKTKDGVPFTEVLVKQGVIPGIKVDTGLVALANTDGEQITQGLDGLAERLTRYKEQGARFAKWRNVYHIDGCCKPSSLAIKANAEMLACYAAICQSVGIVPIVEPEVLMDGEHSIECSYKVTDKVVHAVFHALHKHKVILEGMVLKPSMVISGSTCKQQASIQQVADLTLKMLRNNVPAAVPTINFLSGGQSAEVATEHLNAMNQQHNPWNVSFSYGRALQDPCLKTWAGKAENVKVAQQALHKRIKLNGLAAEGKYNSAMEKDA